MAVKSSWQGYLKLSLVSVPLKGYTAASGGTGRSISLNQLHEPCHSRIRYKKVCPVHGEVPNDEIVSGYEYAEDQYAVIDPDEVDKLRTGKDRSLTVDAFVPGETIDPAYLSGRTYYLVPDGAVGQKPYAVLREGMAERGLHAVGTVVISGQERVVRLRPAGSLLAMDVLEYATKVKAADEFAGEVEKTSATKAERALMGDLIAGMTRDSVDLSEYKDEYAEKLTRLIEAKVAGRELVSPPEADEPEVINLMDALKASVRQVKTPKPKAAAGAKKPPGKMAPSRRTRGAKKAAGQRRKSG